MDKTSNTRQELITEISILYRQMHRIADKLDTLHDPQWADHADEIRGAADVADTWATGLKSELS